MAVVADVFEVVLIDQDGQVAGTADLQDGNIEVSVEESDVRAGRGNQLYGILHSDRDINITLNDMIFKFDWLAKQFGQDIKTGAGVAYAMPKWYQVEDEKVTLEHEPKEDTVHIFDVNGEELEAGTITGKEVALPEGTEGEVEVRTYQFDTDPETQTFVIDNSVFAKGVKAILETVEMDEATETATHLIQYEFHNALPTGNFSFETASAREAQVQEFTMRVVRPRTSNVVGEVRRIPINN